MYGFIISIMKGRNYDDLKSKSPCFLLKKTNFNKNETESKMEIPNTPLERRILCCSSYKNCELKVELMSLRSRKFVFHLSV